MRLDRRRCEELLHRADHGILGTVHADRGVDAVPVCFAVAGAVVAVPVDTVKPKASLELQRSRNLEADPRAVLLCEHWDPRDWANLWWIRAAMEQVAVGAAARQGLERLLGDRYPQYRDRPFADLITFRIVGLEGWSGEVVLETDRGPDRAPDRGPPRPGCSE